MKYRAWFFFNVIVIFLSICYSNVVNSNSSMNNIDATVPNITLKGNNPTIIRLGDSYVDSGAVAIDHKGDGIEITTSGAVNTAKVGKYSITYRVVYNESDTIKKTRVVRVTPSTNMAYQHVRPSDTGVTIGVGVLNEEPKELYTGVKRISSPTVIENKVIEGCLNINSNDVTIRNSIINCKEYYPIRMDSKYNNFKIEYSKIVCSTYPGKIFFFPNGAPNATVSHNEITGCEDFFFIGGDLDGMLIKNNYMHTNIGKPSSHSDGFQIGEFTKATGNIHIQGNYFDPKSPEVPKTALIFSTNKSEVTLLIEDNYIEPFGTYAIRCMNKTICMVKNNVFAQSFYKHTINILLNNSSEVVMFKCNRYANGHFVKEYINNKNVLNNVKHITTDCPSMTVRNIANAYEF